MSHDEHELALDGLEQMRGSLGRRLDACEAGTIEVARASATHDAIDLAGLLQDKMTCITATLDRHGRG